MLLDIIGIILLVQAIKINFSEECFYPASTDSCSHVSATSIKDTDAELKLKQSITIKTHDLCIETKIFTRV